MSDHNHENNLSTLIVGVLIGAGLTYLFTTKSGKKLKKELLIEATKVLEIIGEGIEENFPKQVAELDTVKGKIKEKKDEIEDKVEDVKEEVNQKLENVSQQTQEEIREAPRQAEKIQNKSRRFFFRRSQSRQES